MLEIVVIIYGLVTLIRGKFSLTGQRTLLGWRARVCGGILLAHLLIAFTGGILLAMTGNATTGAAFGVSIASLITVMIVAHVVGSRLYKGQEAETQAMGPFPPPPPPPPPAF